MKRADTTGGVRTIDFVRGRVGERVLCINRKKGVRHRVEIHSLAVPPHADQAPVRQYVSVHVD